ncbi:MAG: hypothetical protein U0W24_08310 [Bacteroidales bacterium]
MGLGILIILLQLLYPPFLHGSYSYIIFIFLVFLIRGGYIFLTIIWKKKENEALKIFKRQDLTFLTFILNTIALSSFFYFFYLHFVVFADSMDRPSGLHVYEYLYQDKPFYLTKDAFDTMKFWEFTIILFIPLSIIVSIINGYTNKKNSNN